MAAQSDVEFALEVEGARFEVVRFELQEGVSQVFRLWLELGSCQAQVQADALLDAQAVFRIVRAGEPVREVHGIVTAFEQGRRGVRRARHAMVVEPPLARLGLWHGSRIHQQQEVPALFQARFKERRLHARWRTAQPHAVREYCVQHRETDLAFFARCLGEEGLVWYFDAGARSQLCITDVLPAGPRLEAPVRYVPQAGGDAGGPHVWRWTVRRQLAVTRAVQRDYTFRNPPYSLEQRSQAREGVGDYEFYDAPGRYKRDEAGQPFTVTKLASLRNAALQAQLEGDDARLWPGLAFTLDGEAFEEAEDAEPTSGPWRIVSMHHRGEQSVSQEEEAAGAEHGTRYAYTATAVPAQANWQAPLPPRPVMDGPQVAHVVGPEQEEIFCDELGRVHVWFPWDRAGPRENATCWMRVSQGWAGAGYGLFTLPRIGHEVIVSFLDGDPDQPLITGRTHPLTQRPPYALPQHKTRSTWKSQTHKGRGSNEIRFEDHAGQEELYVHAQKDQNILVEHNETTRIGHDRREAVGNDEVLTLGQDRQHTLGRDDTLHVGQDRRLGIGRDQRIDLGRTGTLHVGQDLIEQVGNLRQQTTATDWRIQTGGHCTHTVAGRHEIEAAERIRQRTREHHVEAADRIVIRGPGGTITIDDSGITLDGILIEMKGPVQTESNTSPSIDALKSAREAGRSCLHPLPVEEDQEESVVNVRKAARSRGWTERANRIVAAASMDSTSAERSYVIVDCAHAPTLHAQIIESATMSWCLFGDQESLHVRTVAPYLLELGPDHGLHMLIAEGHGRAWCTYLRSELPAESLLEHLRRFVKCRQPVAEVRTVDAYFAFWDPRVALHWLPSLSDEAAARFFSGISAFLAEHPTEPETLIRFRLRGGQVMHDLVPLSGADE